MFWGLSPALDLQEEYPDDDLEEINILLIGGCDARHVLKTLAQAYRHKTKTINIHIIEGCSELVLRQLLLLHVALEPPEKLGLLEKTRMFMEIYGNTLIRQSTCKYVISTARHLLKMITDLGYTESVLPLMSLNKLKYKERDYLEMLLKFWIKSDTNQFNVCELWDRRLRHSLGVRYDCRLGVFDWDYNMRLRDVGGASVNSQEYKHFRSTGVAFTWLETEVCRPNYTLAAGVVLNGEHFFHHGYVGDIVTGPYVAYGLNCEAKDMMKSTNGSFHKRATDITERNIMQIMYEIQTRKSFEYCKHAGDTDYNLGLVTLALSDAKISDCQFDNSTLYKHSRQFTNLEFAKVHFHSYSNLKYYAESSDYQNKFHIMFLSNDQSSKVKPMLRNFMVKGGIILIEGVNFILNMRKENMKAFENEIVKISESLNCNLIGKFDSFINSYAKLQLK